LAQRLQTHGYHDVWALKGGLNAWQEAGYPLQSKTKAA
jgi:rhodanese-related sulfurtransferase